MTKLEFGRDRLCIKCNGRQFRTVTQQRPSIDKTGNVVSKWYKKKVNCYWCSGTGIEPKEK